MPRPIFRPDSNHPFRQFRHPDPRTDVNIRTLAVSQAKKLAAQWDNHPEAVRRAAAEMAGVQNPIAVPEAEAGAAFRVWTHAWRPVMLRPESGIALWLCMWRLLTAKRPAW